MAPSEESILSNFLISPSPLPRIISLEKFTELFPKKLRSHPQIRTLYRELQHVRAQDIALVKENIEREVKNGEKQKEELRQSYAQRGVSNLDARDKMEIDMDIQLFGQPSTTAPEDAHTLDTILPEMQRAISAVEKEIEATEKECSSILAGITTTVEELSDLRYGKLNNLPGADITIAEDVVKGLNSLEDICNSSMK
ncbi:centromere-localized protein 2 [Coccidioides immitis RS]|uniref:Centromere-localized protein 2 n=4 Tax=Coccidioides immitis TaxID=5501 RepID=J3KJ95_COCIM|nr:centromere-localized protein 2 [Coccidioides immitis RS]KMP01428.1 hypothetical protein CIRG_01567 [Coccidioides immitis RMSCC 2394]KMU77306.1 hypothetical protein CISG_06347 [Coccidioides immitis RMSCC 3703]KMU88874.1 hypothetical protein CIHG_06675 [Coccidioides immitis H538.4]TPX25725.1 hypothetical protein DIZ76_011182 [Coccidioides immitis]EAS36115.3 centromere-localized protein 2 [Coccidioides immitis RS]